MSRLLRADAASSAAPAFLPEATLPLSKETIITHLKRCQALVNEHAKQSFERFGDRLSEAFLAALDNARTNQEVTELTGMQRLLRKNHSELARYYTGYIAEGFVKFKNKQLFTTLNAQKNPQELSLVEHADLDEMIVLSSITQRMDTYFAEPLWALNQRFALLNGGAAISEASNPVAPIQLCESLRRALRLVPLTESAKTLVYRTYEEHIMGLVGLNLDEVNAYLKRSGLLPNLQYQPAKSRSRLHTDTLFTPEDLAFMQALGSQSHQEQLLGAIRGLQNTLQTVAGLQATGPALSQHQVVDALNSLQQRGNLPAYASERPISPADFQRVVQSIQELAQQQGGHGEVSAVDLRTIDLVGLVFEYMLNDEHLPASVKALLSYMHTPFLKLAFNDPHFFEKPEHPARLLINSLAEAGSRFVGNDGSVQFAMYQKIKDVVDSVIKDFRNEVSVISELFVEFNSYTKNIIHRQTLMEKRATEKVQGEERLLDVKRRANETLLSKTAHKELPSAVLVFLLQPWSDYVAFILLRYGEASDYLQQALEVVDNILWIIEPKTHLDEMREQADMLAPLLDNMHNGLETIGYDAEKSQALIKAIAALVELATQHKKAEPAPAPMRQQLEKIAAENAGQPPAQDAPISEEEAKVVENLKMIEFGTWFEFEGGKRLKVAWFNARSSQYMLVDQMGKKAATKTGLELAREMLKKQAKIISGSSKPFFERALENIYQKLNAQAQLETRTEA